MLLSSYEPTSKFMPTRAFNGFGMDTCQFGYVGSLRSPPKFMPKKRKFMPRNNLEKRLDLFLFLFFSLYRFWMFYSSLD